MAWTDPFPLRRTEVDGVPTFWVDTPPPLTATLLFRVGNVDETATTAQITHLAEHVIAPGWQPYELGASAGALTTEFWVEGSGEVVITWLDEVTRSIREPPLDRVDRERRRLLAEPDQSTTLGFLAAARFGARGLGLLEHPARGALSVSTDDLLQWCHERFCRENAALILNGSPPVGLRLDLPSGMRHPLPEALPLPHLTLPAELETDGDVLGASFLLEAGPVAELAWTALSRDVRERLWAAGSYTAAVATTPISALTDLVTIRGNTSALHARDTYEALLTGLDTARSGYPPDALTTWIDECCTWFEQIASVEDELDAAATDELIGRRHLPREEVIASMREVDGRQLADAFSDVLGSLLLMRPASLPPTGAIGAGMPEGTFPPPEGEAFDYWPGIREEPDSDRPDVFLGPEGVTIRWKDRTRSVRYADCVAVVRFGDGGVSLIREDDGWVYVPVELLERGDRFVERLREHLPEELFVDEVPPQRSWRELDAMASSRFGARSPIWSDVAYLASELHTHERIAALAAGWIEDEAGVVAVTDQRVVWCHGARSDVDDNVRELRFDRVVSARTHDEDLVVVHGDGSERTIERITPHGAAAELAELVSMSVGARDPWPWLRRA